MPCELAECLSALEDGRIDLVPALAFSPERAERFAFTGETVVVAWGQVFARPDAGVRSILDLEGRRVALTRGSIFVDPFLRLLESFRVKAETVWGASHEEVLRLVAAGEADAGVVNVLLARRAANRYGVEETPILFSPVDVRMAARRQAAPGILHALDRYLAAWKRESDSPYYRALDRWIGLREEPAEIPRWVKLGGAGAGTALLILAAGVVALRREVARRTAALAGRNAELAAEVARREKAERSLAEAVERLRVVLDASPAAIVAVDREGRVTGWSRGAERLFGWSEAEALGREPPHLPEEARGVFREELAKVLAGEEVMARDAERRRKDGRPVWVSVSAAPLRDARGEVVGGVSVMIDATERRRAEEALRRSEARYRRLFEGHSAVQLLVDPETGRILDANDAAASFYGWSRDDLRRMRIQEINTLPPEEVARRMRECRSGEARHFVFRHRRADGSERDVEVFSGPTEVDGVECLHSVVMDVTDRRRAEEARRRLEEKMFQVQKLESLGVLAGGIAHDFNNLLMGVLGHADLALRKLPPESPARRNVESIVTAARRAADLANQMLAYSGKGRFVVEPIDLNRLVEEMGHLLETVIGKGVVLKYALAPNLPAVEGDANQLRQVVMNLITNASEAIGERSGVITVTTGMMHADRAYLSETFLDWDLPEGRYVYLEVSDTGRGMDAETRQKIFDPFFSTKFTGRGLGLAAVLGIVRGHRGGLKVYSEPGRGSTFKILLPASQSAPTAGAGERRDPETRLEGVRILLADDEDTVREVASLMLEELGAQIVTAADGREAVDRFREAPEAFDLVILDMTMPHMDGKEAFSEIRRIRPGMPVILASGYNEQEATNRFAGKGFAGFLRKPYRTAELVEAVGRVLGTAG